VAGLRARPGIEHADGAGTEVRAPAVDADVVKRKDAPAACIHEHPVWPKADHGHPPAWTALRGGSYGHGATGHHCRQKEPKSYPPTSHVLSTLSPAAFDMLYHRYADQVYAGGEAERQQLARLGVEFLKKQAHTGQCIAVQSLRVAGGGGMHCLWELHPGDGAAALVMICDGVAGDGGSGTRATSSGNQPRAGGGPCEVALVR
jgi:hypothetical protein